MVGLARLSFEWPYLAGGVEVQGRYKGDTTVLLEYYKGVAGVL